MYRRSPLTWGAIAFGASAVLTIGAQAMGLSQTGMHGHYVARSFLTLVLAHLMNTVAALGWMAWRGTVRTGWKLQPRYGTRVYFPSRPVFKWYALCVLMSAGSMAASQFPIGVLVQRHQPLSMVNLVAKAQPFLLTLWDWKRSRWFPVIGAVQLAGTAIALEVFLLGAHGVSLNHAVLVSFPLLACVLAGTFVNTALRGVDRKVVDEEVKHFKERHGLEDTAEHEAAFLTAKLIVYGQFGSCLIAAAGLIASAAWWGFPSVHGMGLPLATALFLVCGVANAMAISATVHGSLGVYGVASTATFGLVFVWNSVFQGLPFTGGQFVGTVTIFMGAVALVFVERRVKRKSRASEASAPMP